MLYDLGAVISTDGELIRDAKSKGRENIRIGAYVISVQQSYIYNNVGVNKAVEKLKIKIIFINIETKKEIPFVWLLRGCKSFLQQVISFSNNLR